MCPYRIVVNNSAAKLNTAADQLKTNGNSDQSEKLGRLVVGSESQLVNEEPGPRKMEKRVFSG